MRNEANIAGARDIMLEFARRTGLADAGTAPRRYLWTDAYAVCNFLSLYRATGEMLYRDLALDLIDQVHGVLGRHREDDPREGWISGLDDEAGRAHPTAGGLRIGKAYNERPRSEPVDEAREWERDGQYFHYLTKWMHALSRTAAVTGDSKFAAWAVELAATAYAGFSAASQGSKRLYWKMSIDLSYPLVASSGHHDPLDGYITYAEIDGSGGLALRREMSELAGMIENGRWTTGDPLGIGGLLFDTGRVVQLTAAARMDGAALAATLVASSAASLTAYVRDASLHRPAVARLAFRELGLSIGLRGLEILPHDATRVIAGLNPQLIRSIDNLRRFEPLADAIEAFWQKPANQRSPSWEEHEDINAVMLATSLLPDEFVRV